MRDLAWGASLALGVGLVAWLGAEPPQEPPQEPPREHTPTPRHGPLPAPQGLAEACAQDCGDQEPIWVDLGHGPECLCRPMGC